MSLWSRFKGWVNEHIAQQPSGPLLPDMLSPDVFTPVPPTQEPEYYSEPGDDQITIIDDFGTNQGTQSYGGWYQDSLLTSEEFHAKYDQDFYNLTLIYLLEEQLDIEWDWETWRGNYEARNG